MKSIVNKFKPKRGISRILHIGLNALFPLILFILIKFDPWLAVLLVIISKWRIVAVRPRYWLPNIRANGVDIIVAFSYLLFLDHAGSELTQILLVALYVVWLTVIKPKSSSLFVALQALIGQYIGLMAVFGFQNTMSPSGPPLYMLIIATWVVCYITARHFFTIFDEPFTSLYSHTWGFFGASMVWVLGHWLIYYYGTYAQPTILLSVIGFGLGSLFYLKQNDKLSFPVRRQTVIVLVAIIFVIIFLTDWSSKGF